MHKHLFASVALGATLALAPLALATSASAAPATVTKEECSAGGGYTGGGYNSAGQALCKGGTYDGVPFDHDPAQGWCEDGYHLVVPYPSPPQCVPNIPNARTAPLA
ncbi:hypothetical protein [Streptomyces sp. NPDC088725]|uniref:hypothetical protein n=1 Tax=Streptomyces sp. NPDC088725 TaxID=3365873 RepID=UPI00382CE694